MIRMLIAALAAAAFAVSAAAQELPTAAERHPGLAVEPLAFRAGDGTRLRAVVTKPADKRGRLPAVLYIQALSCDTIALPAEPRDGWEAMLQILVRESGALVWRTEKRGVGGSEGRCDQLDYLTELADHRAALEALRARPDVDPRRIVVFGASMGSNLAPLLMPWTAPITRCSVAAAEMEERHGRGRYGGIGHRQVGVPGARRRC